MPGRVKRSGRPLTAAPNPSASLRVNSVKGLGLRVPSLALRTAQTERRFARRPRARMTEPVISKSLIVTVLGNYQ